jgi:hypothetical protein
MKGRRKRRKCQAMKLKEIREENHIASCHLYICISDDKYMQRNVLGGGAGAGAGGEHSSATYRSCTSRQSITRLISLREKW